MHVELLVEEPSMEVLLEALLPQVVPGHTFGIHVHQGKSDLLSKVEQRLRAYARMTWHDLRVVIVVDRDSDDCVVLKERLTDACEVSGCEALCRIAVEELEAWFFGDIPALQSAYPGVPATLGSKAKFRDPDAITGGTWEALERVLRRAGYYPTGMPKVEVARCIATHMDPNRNRSRSFQVLLEGLRRHVA
jgi:hypothetical protein